MASGVYEGSEPFVFISYSHKDSARVQPLISGLQQRGIRLWYDEGIEAGTEWPAFIEDKLTKCDCVLVFLSNNSIESVNCRNEINVATGLHKEILVAQMDDNVVFKYGMMLQLSSRQKIFCTRHPHRDSLLDEIAKAHILQRCLLQQPVRPPVRQPVRPPVQPQERQPVRPPVQPQERQPVRPPVQPQERQQVRPPVQPPEPQKKTPPKTRLPGFKWHWSIALVLLGCLFAVLCCAAAEEPEILIVTSIFTCFAGVLAINFIPSRFFRIVNSIAFGLGALYICVAWSQFDSDIIGLVIMLMFTVPYVIFFFVARRRIIRRLQAKK